MAGGLTAVASVAARTGVAAAQWEEAVRAAAHLLVEMDAADAAYEDRCVGIVREQGPYIVIAPGVALAHARPEDGARSLGVAVAVLRAAVEFGHPNNDPVDVVFAFASPDKDSHVALLGRLARALADGLTERARNAASDDDARTVLKEAIDHE